MGYVEDLRGKKQGQGRPRWRARYRDPSGRERTTATLRPSTRNDYATLLKTQVLPEFGDLTLAGIDALAVREWVAELVANGLSAKRARKAHQVLSQTLASAVDGGRLPRNVAEGIKLPKAQRREITS